VVAINKIDIEGVKIDKVKKELASFGINIEEYGGDSMCFEVSATKEKGIEDLLEGIELLAEINELSPTPVAEGQIATAYVLESTVDKRLGSVALCILKSGELDDRAYGATEDQNFRV